MESNTERELDNVPPSYNQNQPSPTSSPPTPPSPLPVSVGPGYQNYFFSSSPSISPPFSPNSSPQTSPRPPPSQNIPPPKQSIPSGSVKLRANPADPPPATEYSPLLHANYFEAPAENVYSEFPYEDIEWPRPRRRRATSFFRVCLERICCCCEIPDCCPPLFTD